MQVRVASFDAELIDALLRKESLFIVSLNVDDRMPTVDSSNSLL